MQRIGIGLLWCAGFFMVLYLLENFGVALAAICHIRDLQDQQAAIDALIRFINAHRGLLRLLDVLALLLAGLLATLGTWKGVLPDTRTRASRFWHC